MVFDDVLDDFKIFMDLTHKYATRNCLISSALKMIYKYQLTMQNYTNLYFRSSRTDSDKTKLINGLNSLENSFSKEIAAMSTSIRNTAKLVSEVQTIDFQSNSVRHLTEEFCDSLNKLMDITEEYIANKLKNESNIATFHQLIGCLEEYRTINSRLNKYYTLLDEIGAELLGNMPLDDSENSKASYLNIRSHKPELNIASFTDDLKLLSDCLQNLERIVSPNENNSIFICKIESGSLKAMFGSGNIDFSIFPDLITSISNAIKTWRLTPIEKEKLQAEIELLRVQTEAQRIKNEGSKMAIINSQINFLCEKLSLDPKDPACREQIEKFCLPLITYLEHNPIGSFNDVQYDISKDVHLLENSDNQGKL